MKALIIDVDGVLLNWKSNLPFFMTQLGIQHKLNDLSLINTDIHAHEMFKNTSTDETRKLIAAYTEHDSAKYMPAYEDAYSTLERLAKTHKIIALTKFGWSRTAWCNRQFNLSALFPHMIDELVSIEFHENKSVYIKDLQKRHDIEFFIDDRIENINDIKKNFPDICCLHVDRHNNQSSALAHATAFL